MRWWVLFVYWTPNKAFTNMLIRKEDVAPRSRSLFLLLSVSVALLSVCLIMWQACASTLPRTSTSAVKSPISLNWQPQLCHVNNVSYEWKQPVKPAADKKALKDPIHRPIKNTFFIYPNTHFLIVLLFWCFAISYFKERISDVLCCVHVMWDGWQRKVKIVNNL